MTSSFYLGETEPGHGAGKLSSDRYFGRGLPAATQMWSQAPVPDTEKPMTSTISTASAHADDADLTSLGYQPSLHRKLGRYASFAAGFSFVSILTTIFQLFAFGYSFAGPAFFWTWPVVLDRPVARCPELRRARRPLPAVRRRLPVVPPHGRRSGRLVRRLVHGPSRRWSRRLPPPSRCRWCSRNCGTASRSSAATARWPPSTGAANAVVLGAVLLVVTTVINCLGVKLMSQDQLHRRDLRDRRRDRGHPGLIFRRPARTRGRVGHRRGGRLGPRRRRRVPRLRADGGLRHGRLRLRRANSRRRRGTRAGRRRARSSRP